MYKLLKCKNNFDQLGGNAVVVKKKGGGGMDFVVTDEVQILLSHLVAK